MELGLAIEMEISGSFLPFDIMWSWEVSGGPMSWTRQSHLRATGLTPSQSTKTLSSTWLRIKGGKKETKERKEGRKEERKGKKEERKKRKLLK